MLVQEGGTGHILSLFLVSNDNKRFFLRVMGNDLPVFGKLVIFQCPQIGSLGLQLTDPEGEAS